jgi:hypothetical protein
MPSLPSTVLRILDHIFNSFQKRADRPTFTFQRHNHCRTLAPVLVLRYCGASLVNIRETARQLEAPPRIYNWSQKRIETVAQIVENKKGDRKDGPNRKSDSGSLTRSFAIREKLDFNSTRSFEFVRALLQNT